MCYDFSWLFMELPTDVPITFYVDYNKKFPAKPERISDSWMLIYPPFPHYMKYGTMHAKIMLLEFTQFVRVVIASANLVPLDYNEVENIVFIQDFPIQEGATLANAATNPLALKLRSFFAKFPEFTFDWNGYVWSRAKVEPIFSIPGTYSTEAIGIIQLQKAFAPFQERIATLEIQATSYGGIGLDRWIQETVPYLCNPAQTTVKIVYPSIQYALASPFGEAGFCTIFMKMKDFLGSVFLKTHLYNCQSIRYGSAMHTKIIAAYDKTGNLLCFYFGSHNFSRSAWGYQTKAGDKICINNYEMGIFSTPDKLPLFLPYISPPHKYASEDIPWTQE